MHCGKLPGQRTGERPTDTTGPAHLSRSCWHYPIRFWEPSRRFPEPVFCFFLWFFLFFSFFLFLCGHVFLFLFLFPFSFFQFNFSFSRNIQDSKKSSNFGKCSCFQILFIISKNVRISNLFGNFKKCSLFFENVPAFKFCSEILKSIRFFSRYFENNVNEFPKFFVFSFLFQFNFSFRTFLKITNIVQNFKKCSHFEICSLIPKMFTISKNVCGFNF